VRKYGLLVFSLLLTALPAPAQDVLPGSFAQWTPGPIERLSCAGLEALVGEPAATLRDYGCRAVERRAYQRGGATLTVTAYTFGDSTAAYAAFTFLRPVQMKASSVAAVAGLSQELLLAVAGDAVVEVRGANLESDLGDLRALVARLQAGAQSAPLPVLPEYLPKDGLVDASRRYLLGRSALDRLLPLADADWLGFESGAEAELAAYRRGGQDLTLVVAQFPTPQSAGARLEALRRWFNVNAEEEVVAGRPVVFARRSGPLVAIVANAASPAAAVDLLNEVRYESQVTWNEPSFTATEPTWGEFILGIFYGTGIFILFAVVSGLVFAGVRLVVKRLLPGKVFDRDASVEILQLGLGSKPIEGKDFYGPNR
jgi:hypothetical protein